MTTNPSAPALDGIRVLDLATVLAAPVTATFLADFGAEVIKVEEPGRGDFTRGNDAGRRSPHWAQEARNKRSITCNLRDVRGQQLIRRLVPTFDVVVTNYRPPTLESWGLGPEDLSTIAPRTVLAYLTAYGLTGPYRDRGAFDRIASSFSGLTHVTGHPDQPPVRSGYAVIDYMSAYLAAFGVMVALYHRDVHGAAGQVIDLALYEAGFRASEDALVRHAVDGSVRGRRGNRNERIVPATDVLGSDGRWWSFHAGTDALFKRLATAIGEPSLSDDPRFATRAARIGNQEELYTILATWAGERTADEAMTALNAENVPAAVIMDIADISVDPHYRERGTIVDVADDDFGALPMVSPLPHLSETPGRIRTTGPALGEANHEVYGGLLGISEVELAGLREDGVL